MPGTSRGKRYTQPRRRCAFWVSAAALLWSVGTWVVGGSLLLAATGEVQQLPTANTKPRNGIRLTLDSRGVDGYGYRPIRVTLRRVLGGANAPARSFRVEIRPIHWGQQGTTPEVVQVVEIPQGVRSATDTIAVPQISNWSNLRVDVYERGRKLDDLSGYLSVTFNRGHHQWSEGKPSMLFIDRDVPSRDAWASVAATNRTAGKSPLADRFLIPDPRGLAVAAPGEDSNAVFNTASSDRLDDQTIVGLTDTLRRIDFQNLAELPKRWIDYTCLDLIVISREDLETLARTDPTRFDALRRWTTTGQTLVVYGVGDGFSGLAELEQQLGMPPLPAAEGTVSGWRLPDAKQFGDQVLKSIHTGTSRTLNGRHVALNVHRQVEQGTDQLLELAKRPPEQPPFVIRSFGLGQVVAFGSEEPFPGSAQKWCWMFNSLGEEQFKAYQRLGVSQHRENKEFWEWLIPGVGQAPVISFAVLITLFAVAIGPVNYFLLKRMRRLYLLLITVPLGAAAVTFCLFAYALLTDGLGTKVRVRSVAWVDQGTGQFASCSRQTYYASIAPSQGLLFPAESLVVPVYGRPMTEANTGNQFTRRLTWSDQQQLDRDFLRSRVTSQYVVLHAGRRDVELVVRQQEGQPPQIENQLAPRIEQLALRDKEGRLWQASGVARGDRATLQPATARELKDVLRPIYLEHRPEAPGKLDANVYSGSFLSDMFGYRRGSSVDAQEATPSWSDSLLERHLKRFLENPGDLPEGHYVAIVDTSPLAPVGVQRARQVAGFHVIVGNWRDQP